MREVVGAQRHVLYALALVLLEVLFDLPSLARVLVDRDPDLPVRARHRAGVQPRELALNVEVADLPEVEEALVKTRPLTQPAAIDVVRQVVEVVQADPGGPWIGFAEPLEIDIVDRPFRAVAIHE